MGTRKRSSSTLYGLWGVVYMKRTVGTTRTSIMLKDLFAVKIRKLQGERIKKSGKLVSFSSVVNDVLEKGMKK